MITNGKPTVRTELTVAGSAVELRELESFCEALRRHGAEGSDVIVVRTPAAGGAVSMIAETVVTSRSARADSDGESEGRMDYRSGWVDATEFVRHDSAAEGSMILTSYQSGLVSRMEMERARAIVGTTP